jgi:hypothetical protein
MLEYAGQIRLPDFQSGATIAVQKTAGFSFRRVALRRIQKNGCSLIIDHSLNSIGHSSPAAGSQLKFTR